MEQSLKLVEVAPPRARIAFARLLQTIGWAGLAGIALACIAVVVGHSAWSKRGALIVEDAGARTRQVASLPLTATKVEPVPIRLPRRADVPLLLTRIERAVVGNGLPWAAGDYRLVPASDRQAAALEVRCAFKAPYPKLRAMLAEVLGSAPAVTFREMSFSRLGIDTPEVDARFAIVMFLSDDEERLAPPAGER